MDSRTPAQTELRQQVDRVARECRSARRWRAVLRFAWFLFLVTLVLTVALRFAPAGWLPAWLALTLWIGVALFAFVVYVLRPLRNPITIEQVALFIDEHHPELENRIITAIQTQTDHAPSRSEWMLHHFLSEALPKLSHTSFAGESSQHGFSRHGLNALALIAACVAIAFAYRELWFADMPFYRTARDSGPAALPFTVEPGDVRVRQGDNVMVWVRGAGEHDKILVRWSEGSGEWQSAPARRGTSGDVSFYEFKDVRVPITYQVGAGPATSELFEIRPWVPAEVDAIDLEYNYPGYLGRPDREVPNSGHITAVEGTSVGMTVRTNREVEGATMVLESGERIPLKRGPEGMVWTHDFLLKKSDAYWIELTDSQTEADAEAFHTKYGITAKRDEPPEVQVAFPRGDGQVTMLEELPFRFVVTDDFGFEDYGLQYQIGGDDPVKLPLEAEGGVVTKIEGEHLLPLEDLSVNVGDLITWTVWARDAKPDRESYEMVGDPYFIEVRPFQYRYRESVSGAGGMQGGAQGGEELVQRQREIIIATWDLRRDADYLDPEEFAERRDIVRDSQKSIQEQIAQTRMSGENAALLVQLRQAVQDAVDALDEAELPDPVAVLSKAAVHEQRAYHLMLKLQSPDVQVQQQRGGGGGAGQQQDRYGIDELEMDRNRNFYEEEQSTQQQQQAADELTQRLKELARRQKLIDEEIAKLISELQRAETPEEREKLRRRLEKLQEELEKNLQQLDEAEQQMSSSEMSSDQSQQARGAMRDARRELNRSLENVEEEELQQARASSARATRALEDLERQLRQLSGSAASERLRDIQEQLEELQQRQRAIQQEVEEMREQHHSPSFEGEEDMQARQEELKEEKEALGEHYVELMNQAGELAERARESQELMSRSLNDWLRETSREGILEDIENSKPLVDYGVWDSATEAEARIKRKFDKASEGLAKVAENLVEDDLESKQLALQRLEELLNEAEGMREAMGGDEQGDEKAETGTAGQQQTETGEGSAAGEEQAEEGSAAGEEQAEGEEQGSGESGETTQLAESDQPGSERRASDASEQEGPERGASGSEDPENPQFRESPSEVGDGMPGESPEEIMRRFVSEDYSDWVEELRNVESLLPNESDARERVGRVRESIESFRRTWRDRALAPQFDLFVEMADEPLREAADRLHREIQLERGEAEFLLVDDTEIPHQYRELVADYFRDLAQSQKAQ